MQNYSEMTEIPSVITVHLGAPGDAGENVTVNFPDYIKSVASNTLSPFLPENALKAAVYVIVTQALDRSNDSTYRRQGYPFDTTSSPLYDFKYTDMPSVFENINDIVNSQYNDYITGNADNAPYDFPDNPAFSTEQSAELARQGKSPLEILQYFYGSSIRIVENAPLDLQSGLFTPDLPLGKGSLGNSVSELQLVLNRIGENYPTLSRVSDANGVYGQSTALAVGEFQRLFDLPKDGNVDLKTWNTLLYVYSGIKNLNSLANIERDMTGNKTQFTSALKTGSAGEAVRQLQYYLSFVSAFDGKIPAVRINGIYDGNTETAVKAFQSEFDLKTTGEADVDLQNRLFNIYSGLFSVLPESSFGDSEYKYSGNTLSVGSRGGDVSVLEKYLNVISDTYTDIPKVKNDGSFDKDTEKAVLSYQKLFGLNESGNVTSTTWKSISDTYDLIKISSVKKPDDYPGYDLM